MTFCLCESQRRNLLRRFVSFEFRLQYLAPSASANYNKMAILRVRERMNTGTRIQWQSGRFLDKAYDSFVQENNKRLWGIGCENVESEFGGRKNGKSNVDRSVHRNRFWTNKNFVIFVKPVKPQTLQCNVYI